MHAPPHADPLEQQAMETGKSQAEERRLKLDHGNRKKSSSTILKK
jgi:hypothetical protein